MQKFAKTIEGQLISIQQASPQERYVCLECSDVVFPKFGEIKTSHFCHLATSTCRQNGKTAIHWAVQFALQERIGHDDIQLERFFPSIKRVADVAWEREKIIFEIQYSPITYKEVYERNRDYESLGWHVVWILHDHTFNQKKVTGAEAFLESSSRYFTNMDESGVGVIYDQWELSKAGFRSKKLTSFPTAIERPKRLSLPSSALEHFSPLQNGKLYFQGDRLDRWLKGQDTPPRKIPPNPPWSWKKWTKSAIKEAWTLLIEGGAKR